MAKNIAWCMNRISSLEVERGILYNMYLRPIDEEIKDLKETIRTKCKHPADMILIEKSHEEDEYGKHMSSWDMYEFTCTVCKKRKRVNAKWYEKLSDRNFSDLLELTQEELDRLK